MTTFRDPLGAELCTICALPVNPPVLFARNGARTWGELDVPTCGCGKCDECADPIEDGTGCHHDRDLCNACLHLCSECVVYLQDDMAAEAAHDGRWC